MFIFITKQTRPSNNVDFFTPKKMNEIDEGYSTYFNEKYVITEKFLHAYSEVSESGLELTTTAIWEDKNYAEEFKNDPVVIERFIKIKNRYLEENNIKTEIASEETV